MDQHGPYLREMGLTRWRFGSQSTDRTKFPSNKEQHFRDGSLKANLGNLAVLAREADGCRRCGLHRTRGKVVFGSGSAAARWMFVGEAPGAEEDKQGLPFVGRAGVLLGAMLNSIRLSRDDVYIANVLKCRPPNNRDPFGQEVRECAPFLHRQIDLVQPEIIVAMGRFAAQVLLDSDQNLGQLRGRPHNFGETSAPLVVTYHPAYLLRSPAAKSKTWEDLLLARSLLT
jgi:uracil-DNA glycosylase family 4